MVGSRLQKWLAKVSPWKGHERSRGDYVENVFQKAVEQHDEARKLSAELREQRKLNSFATMIEKELRRRP